MSTHLLAIHPSVNKNHYRDVERTFIPDICQLRFPNLYKAGYLSTSFCAAGNRASPYVRGRRPPRLPPGGDPRRRARPRRRRRGYRVVPPRLARAPRRLLPLPPRPPLRRRRESGAGGPAFRTAAGNLASLLELHIRSLALDASEGQGYHDDAMWVEDGEFDEADDLHLTAGESIMAWAATAAGSSLREVEIADFWPQSCWRKAEALPVISQFCHSLLKLGLRNAWLSVDGLKIMLNLTHLMLEFIRLDDENLSKLNECFPCLQILDLIGVGGLKDPKIHLPQLKTCRWEVSNVPRSLAIHAPNLVYLELKCVRPEMLILDTPCMSTLKLTIDKLGPTVRIEDLVSLTNLRIESLDLNSLLQLFTNNRDISTLELELPVSASRYELFEAVKPEYLLQLFASISEVKLAPRFSCELMKCLVLCMDSQFRSCLKKLLVHLPPTDTVPLFVHLFKNCAPLCEVTVLFHADSTDEIRQGTISAWTVNFPEIRWQWGNWK